MSKEESIGAYRGIVGLKNLEKTNPEEYRRLSALLDFAKSKYTDKGSKEYYMMNYMTNGWFREALRGREIFKSKIDDTKISINQGISASKSPATQRAMSNVIRFLNGNKDSISRDVAKADTESLQNSVIYLDDVVNHKELFDSYPQTRDIKAVFYWDDSNHSVSGWYSSFDGDGTIALNVASISKDKDPMQSLKDTIMHEVQHAL